MFFAEGELDKNMVCAILHKLAELRIICPKNLHILEKYSTFVPDTIYALQFLRISPFPPDSVYALLVRV